MKLSKTQIKQYTRCVRCFALDDIYRRKLNSSVSLFADEKIEKLTEYLETMFDSETGEDLIDITNPQMEALLPYYNMVEDYAMQIAEELFGENIIHDIDTKKQYLASFHDSNYQYYCYLDGYQEKENIVNIFEVKATTSKKFAEFGPCIDKVRKSLFLKNAHIYSLAPSINDYLDEKKYQEYYHKLFNRYNTVGKYIFDMAIERYIIENSESYNGDKTYHYYLVVLNHQYVFDGSYLDDKMVYNIDKNGNHLVVFIDLDEITKEYQPLIKQQMKYLKQFIDFNNPALGKVGTNCERKKMTECFFVPSCWQKVLEPGSILEYKDNHHGFEDENGVKYSIFDLIDEGKYCLNSIPKEWLKRPVNQIQRECFDNNQEYFNKDKIITGLELIKYPLYHLDFESFPAPLPRFKGEKAYSQSLFQFSIHVEREPGLCDKEKDHLEFLAINNVCDCREDLVKALIEYIDLKNGGTVLVYNISFEKTRIKELADIFPQYRSELLRINQHMFDLLDIIKGSKKMYEELGFATEEAKGINYYNNKLRGSFSIKKVLPIFSDLSYKDLIVANGTEAIAAYAKFNELAADEREELRLHLKKYCQQDTWAMVVILWGLTNKVTKLAAKAQVLTKVESLKKIRATTKDKIKEPVES